MRSSRIINKIIESKYSERDRTTPAEEDGGRRVGSAPMRARCNDAVVCYLYSNPHIKTHWSQRGRVRKWCVATCVTRCQTLNRLHCDTSDTNQTLCLEASRAFFQRKSSRKKKLSAFFLPRCLLILYSTLSSV
jgi:hypothetical protein